MHGQISINFFSSEIWVLFLDLDHSLQVISIDPHPFGSLVVTESMSNLTDYSIIIVIIVTGIVFVERVQSFDSYTFFSDKMFFNIGKMQFGLVWIEQFWGNCHGNTSIWSQTVLCSWILRAQSKIFVHVKNIHIFCLIL